jgi:hypothetical protein
MSRRLFLSLSLVATSFASLPPFSLPIGLTNTSARANSISSIRNSFEYGPDIVNGNGSAFPVGSYANALITNYSNSFFTPLQEWVKIVGEDAQIAGGAVVQVR